MPPSFFSLPLPHRKIPFLSWIFSSYDARSSEWGDKNSNSFLNSKHIVSRLSFRTSVSSKLGTDFAAIRLIPRFWEKTHRKVLHGNPVNSDVSTIVWSTIYDHFLNFLDIFICSARWRQSRTWLIFKRIFVIFKTTNPLGNSRVTL